MTLLVLPRVFGRQETSTAASPGLNGLAVTLPCCRVAWGTRDFRHGCREGLGAEMALVPGACLFGCEEPPTRIWPCGPTGQIRYVPVGHRDNRDRCLGPRGCNVNVPGGHGATTLASRWATGPTLGAARRGAAGELG